MIVNVLANTTGFASGMAKVRGELGKTQQAANATGLVFSKLGAGLGALGVGFSSAAVIGNLRNTAQEIDNLAKTADRLGMSTESFKGLEFGAGLAGISSEQLAGSLQTLTKQIGEAVHGGGKAKVVFSELGVDIEKLAKMTPEVQLGLFADLLKDVKDESERTRIAMRLFGGDGAGMLNFLAEGSDAIRGYIREAKELGLTYSREEAAKVEAFNDAWERLSKTLGGISKDIVIQIAPEAFEAVEWLREAFAGAKGLASKAKSAQSPAAEFLSGIAPGSGERNAIVSWYRKYLDSATKLEIEKDLKQSGFGTDAPAFTQAELGTRTAARLAAFQEGRNRIPDIVNPAVYRERASKLAESLTANGANRIESAFKAMSEGLKAAEEFGPRAQRNWALKQLFPTEGPVDRFFSDREQKLKERDRKLEAEARLKQFESRPNTLPGGLNQAIEAGTVEAFRAIAESKLQRQMLSEAQETNEHLAQLNRQLQLDVTGLN